MVVELWKWVINLPLNFVEFGKWLITPLPYINLAPLMLFSVGGITILIGVLLIRLFIGG